MLCDNIPNLSGSQRRLCQEYSDIMVNFGEGVKLAVEECQEQFRNNRWNCSTFQSSRDTSLFANFLLRGRLTMSLLICVERGMPRNNDIVQINSPFLLLFLFPTIDPQTKI